MGTQMAAQVQAWADGAAAQLNQEATAAAQTAADAAASQASADAAKQANDQLSAAAAALDAQISAAKSAGNTELADSLSKARNQIGSVSDYPSGTELRNRAPGSLRSCGNAAEDERHQEPVQRSAEDGCSSDAAA